MSKEELDRESFLEEVNRVQHNKSRDEKREQILEAIGPVKELKSDYLNTSTYYYNEEQNKIYEIENMKMNLTLPLKDVDKHLRELNSLPAKD